jgi:hypothetical protein
MIPGMGKDGIWIISKGGGRPSDMTEEIIQHNLDLTGNDTELH